MKRLFLAIGAAIVLIVTVAPGASLARTPFPTERDVAATRLDPRFTPAVLRRTERVDVLVQLAGDPVAVAQAAALDGADGKRLTDTERKRMRSRLAERQSQLAPRIRSLGGKVVAQYQDALNAVRVTISLDRVAQLSRLSGVVRVQQVRIYTRGNVNTDAFVGADKAWAAKHGYAGYTGYKGAGQRIAIVDTGIDYYHANFGGSGDPRDFACDSGTDRTGDDEKGCDPARGDPDTFPTAKVVGGWDFVGDCYSASAAGTGRGPATAECPRGLTAVPQPDPDPLDCDGHGSHVAGTAAGFGVVGGASPARFRGPYNATTLARNGFVIAPGVAPAAKLVAYRVFGCDGTTSVVIDAIDRAVRDGVDVINLSLGSPFGRADELDAQAVDNASRAGITVVAAAGNAGQSAYLPSSPATATSAISVAAIDAVPSFPTGVVGFQRSADQATRNLNGKDIAKPIAGRVNVFQDVARTACDPATGIGCEQTGCDAASYDANRFAKGDIVVVTRGGCPRVQKAHLADAKGAVAVVMVNNDASEPPYEGAIAGVDIPFLGVANTAAVVKKFVAENGRRATISAGRRVESAEHRTLAEFSTGGPRNGDAAVKPDVAAPGVSVVSTLAGGGVAGTRISGTSVAAPAVAGVAALVREAHPRWSAARIKAAIVGTADPGGFRTGGYDVRRSGAGVIQARRAVDTVSLLTTPSGSNLDFGYAELGAAFSATRTATLSNVGRTPITYDLSVAFNKSPLGFTARVSPSTVTIPARGSAEVRVTLSATAATVAALPNSNVPIAASTSLTTIRGNLVATPTRTGPGIYRVRAPFLLAPRAVSDVATADRTEYVVHGDDAITSVGVTNRGIHAAEADVYQWGLSDAKEGHASGDLRAVGAQTFSTPDGQLVVFAVNTWSSWSNQAVDEYDILIDSAPCPADAPADAAPCRDSDAEYMLVTGDYGAMFNGAFDGTTVTVLLDAAGKPVGSRTGIQGFNPALPNGSTMLIPFWPGDAGLGPVEGKPTRDTDFAYSVVASSLVPGSHTDAIATAEGKDTAWASFDPWAPAVSQGALLSLGAGETRSLGLAVHRAIAAGQAHPALGWMVVTTNDGNGEDQADLIELGTVPPTVE